MKPITIAGANANPGAPKGWDPAKDGTCGRLPIRYTEKDGRIEQCESAWVPDQHELDRLVAGAAVVLRVIGWQVPVALYVEKQPPTSKTVEPRELPRRCYADLYTPAEAAISYAMRAVEAAGADPFLTEAVTLLSQAKDKVADYVDKIAAEKAPDLDRKAG